MPLAPVCKGDEQILTLWLKTDPFCRMACGRKDKEYRRRSQWIEQRLFETDSQEEDPTSYLYMPSDDVRTIDPALFRKRRHREYEWIRFKNKMDVDSPIFYTKFLGVKRLSKLPKHIQKKNTVTKKAGDSSSSEEEAEQHYYELSLGPVKWKNAEANQLMRDYKKLQKEKRRARELKEKQKAEKDRILAEKQKRREEREAKRQKKSKVPKSRKVKKSPKRGKDVLTRGKKRKVVKNVGKAKPSKLKNKLRKKRSARKSKKKRYSASY